MKEKNNSIIAEFYSALSDLFNWLKGCPSVVIGGMAVALLGRPRFTRDIDTMVLLGNEKWADLYDKAGKYGFEPRISDAMKFAARHRALLMRHKSSGVEIDISFGAFPFEEECIGRARIIKIAGMKIPVLSPEDLIIMKAIAHRGKDVADIESILDVHPKVDTKRIERRVKEFSRVLEMPEIWEDVKKLIRGKGR